MNIGAGHAIASLAPPQRRTAASFAALLGGLVVLPWVLADYQRIFVAEIFVWGLFALSFALVYGYGGMLSFAQAVFFGAGCYGFNLGTFYFGFNTWGAIVSAVGAAVLFALPVGYLATRARQHHFLIVTVIFSVLVYSLLQSGHWNWMFGPYVTRSLTFVPDVPLGFGSPSFIHETVAYYFTLAITAVVFVLCFCHTTSPFGRAMLAARDNELRAKLIGLNVNRLRFQIFLAGAAVAGVAGALYALLARYTNLEFFHWMYSGKAVVMAIIGGVQSVFGPFLGTAFYMIANEYMSRYFEHFIVIFGILLIIVLRYAPNGIWGVIMRLANEVRRS